MAKLDQVNYKGTIAEIVPEIAPLFKTTETYAAGDQVIYEADWYTFKEAKEAGAWDATKVDGPFKVADEIVSLKEELSDANEIIGATKYKIAGALIDSSGKIETGVAYDTWIFEVSPYKKIKKISVSNIQYLVYAFYTSKPELGSVSYNSSRSMTSTTTQTNLSVPAGCNWIAIRTNAGETCEVSPIGTVINTALDAVVVLTPEMFGAVGDGATGDTIAIQAMFDKAADLADTCAVVCHGKPGSVYKVQSIQIKTAQNNYTHNITIYGFTFSHASDTLFTATNNNHFGFHFVGCNFIGYSTALCVLFSNYIFTYTTFENCTFTNYKNIIYCSTFEQEISFISCHFSNVKSCFYGTGFFTLKVSGCVFYNCESILQQVLIDSNLGMYYRVASDVTFEDCYFNSFDAYAIKLSAYTDVSISRCFFEYGSGNYYGVYLTESDDFTRGKFQISIKDNHFQETISAQYSPKLLCAANCNIGSVAVCDNVSYNSRFIDISNSNVDGVVTYSGNILTSGNADIGVLGDISSIDFNGNVNADHYIKGKKIVFNNDNSITWE